MNLNTISNGTWDKIAEYLNINFNKLNVFAGKLSEIKLLSFKGFYLTSIELKRLQKPTTPGDYAFVSIGREDNSFKIYYVDFDYKWVTDNGTYTPEVILKDYITMTTLSNVENDLKKDIDDYNRQH